jgi:hypothetical protein
MNIKQTLKIGMLVFIMALGLSVAAVPHRASATGSCDGVDTNIISCNQDSSNGTCPDGTVVALSSSCPDGSKPILAVENTGVWGLLLMAINILTAGIGILAVAGIVYGSVLYASAGGSPEQVKKAMGIISNVVIGIVAYALMYALLNFLIPGGLFD